MSKIWKNNIKVIRKSNLKRRLELKLSAFLVKNLCLIFKISLPQANFVSGGLSERSQMTYSALP